MSEHDDKRCKVAYCKCGIRVIQCSILPDGDTDKDILKRYRKLAKEGHQIDYMTVKEMKELFGDCFNGECWKEKQAQIKTENTTT